MKKNQFICYYLFVSQEIKYFFQFFTFSVFVRSSSSRFIKKLFSRFIMAIRFLTNKLNFNLGSSTKVVARK